MKIFVYGTLKRGHSRAAYLRGQRFLGDVKTLPKYRLYNCGNYPGLVLDHNGIAIEGEVWNVDATCLKTLDDVEGTDEGLYRRAIVELEEPFEATRVETYLYARSTYGLKDCGSRWDGGASSEED